AAASASMGAVSHSQRPPTRPTEAFPLNAGVAAAQPVHTAVLQRSGAAGSPGRVGADTGAGHGWLFPVLAFSCLAVGSRCLAIGIAVARGQRNSLPDGAARRDADSSLLRPRPPFRYSWRHTEWFPTGAGAALMPLVGYVSPIAQRGDNRRQDLR